MGSDSIDFGLKNIYKSWFNYRKGKKPNIEIDAFQYNLENEFFGLWKDLNDGTYKHGSYRKFVVCDNKRREISVASIRDRVVHRLLYDYLSAIFDKGFIYDAWSCRIGKGLVGAIERAQQFALEYRGGYFWRADIKKYFDNVDHEVLLGVLLRKIKDQKAAKLLAEVIKSFPEKGMPIGNLTSQIFSNIYLNELDRFIKNELRVKAYLRYGDDFVIFSDKLDVLFEIKAKVEKFITCCLKLKLHPTNNIIRKTKHGLKFLGVEIYPRGRRLNKRSLARIRTKLNLTNYASYWGVVRKHCGEKRVMEFQWRVAEMKL